MATLTFLGASGGAGTTTLAALSLHLLAENDLRLPVLIAAEADAFNARLGIVPQAVRATGHELVDAGRYTTAKAAAALAQGRLVLVGAHTPRGVAAHDDALAEITARFGQAGIGRTLPVLCASFGGRPPAVEDQRIAIPFDPRLAPGGDVSEALPALRSRTLGMLRQHWLPVLREVYS
ncbi:MAG: hypothetical protein QM713_09975 [Arachnia sp.]